MELGTSAVTRRDAGVSQSKTILVLEGYAMFAACHFVSQILEIGYSLVISSACVMILGVRQDFVNEQTQF